LRGFNLIETIISVVILLFIVSVALNVLANKRYLLNLSLQKDEFLYKASVGALEERGKNVYENLVDFRIDDDRIIRVLKKDNFFKSFEVDSKQDFGEFNILIEKVRVYNKEFSLNVYRVK
jgi:prepilin-type N-terminal cleavage/methylation domain-containing protein